MLLVVPPELYWEAATLLESAYFPDALTRPIKTWRLNPLRGMLSLMTTPYLTRPGDWYLLDTIAGGAGDCASDAEGVRV